MTESKKCSKCDEIKATAEFYKRGKYLTSLCKICSNKKSQEWKRNNKQKVSQYNKKWAQDNKKERNKYRAELDKKRRKHDVLFKLKEKIRTITKRSFRKIKSNKSTTTQTALGCSFEELKVYLEAQFKPGMTWENRSEWHIDHIIPLASAKTEEEVIKLCHYTNLQPLWAHENLAKGAKITS